MQKISSYLIPVGVAVFTIFPKSGTAQVMPNDEFAISLDAHAVTVQKGKGIDVGVAYQLWKYSLLELTASGMKVDNLDYQFGDVQYKHNYAHLQAGIKFNYRITDYLTLSPELGVSYAFLNHLGATTELADKGWYLGTELEWRYTNQFSLLLTAQSHQKVFALEDDVMLGIGIRYTPYAKYKSSSKRRQRIESAGRSVSNISNSAVSRESEVYIPLPKPSKVELAIEQELDPKPNNSLTASVSLPIEVGMATKMHIESSELNEQPVKLSDQGSQTKRLQIGCLFNA